MTQPTARQVWRRLVDEAGEDEIAAVLSRRAHANRLPRLDVRAVRAERHRGE
jgi:hypothetical protein